MPLRTPLQILNKVVDWTNARLKVSAELSGRIVEYAWLDGATAPTPTEDFAWGYKFNAATGVLTTYGWTGAAWVEVV